jgi:hypothetical protein
VPKNANDKRHWFLRKSSPRFWGGRLDAKALAHYQRSTIFGLFLVFGGVVGLTLSVIVSLAQGDTNYVVLFVVVGYDLLLGFFMLFEYRLVKLVAAKQYGFSKREAVRLNIFDAPSFDASLRQILRDRESRGTR